MVVDIKYHSATKSSINKNPKNKAKSNNSKIVVNPNSNTNAYSDPYENPYVNPYENPYENPYGNMKHMHKNNPIEPYYHIIFNKQFQYIQYNLI